MKHSWMLLWILLALLHCSAAQMCKYLMLDETIVALHSDQVQHTFFSRITPAANFTSWLEGDSSNDLGDVSISFQLMTTHSAVKLEYLTLEDAAGLQLLRIANWTAAAAPGTNVSLSKQPGEWSEMIIPISQDAYTVAAAAGAAADWGAAAGLRFVFKTNSSSQEGAVSFRLLRLCKALPAPSLCTQRQQYTYKINCHECACKKCHTCACEVQSLFWGASCAYDVCDHDGE
jgi:hypothetical protein